MRERGKQAGLLCWEKNFLEVRSEGVQRQLLLFFQKGRGRLSLKIVAAQVGVGVGVRSWPDCLGHSTRNKTSLSSVVPPIMFVRLV